MNVMITCTWLQQKKGGVTKTTVADVMMNYQQVAAYLEGAEARKNTVFTMQHVAAGVGISLHLAVPGITTVTIAKTQPKIEHHADHAMIHFGQELLSGWAEFKAIRRRVVKHFRPAWLGRANNGYGRPFLLTHKLMVVSSVGAFLSVCQLRTSLLPVTVVDGVAGVWADVISDIMGSVVE
uniref:Uncharacterized protein n=1 Tax=Romanomermis culicivorax TaxID=13658 RepID=A0A915IJY0_ROMCU